MACDGSELGDRQFLGLVEDVDWQGDHADVMEQGPNTDTHNLMGLEPQFDREGGSEIRHPLRVDVGLGVEGFKDRQ